MGTAVKRVHAKAVIECFEEIPCNPCESSCPSKAISLNGAIYNIPQLNEDLCIGCGICITRCSGQAIFVTDDTYSDTLCSISMPYEFYPLPEAGMEIDATDRNGEFVCKGTVKKVLTAEKFDHTAVLTIEVPIEYIDTVRAIKRL